MLEKIIKSIVFEKYQQKIEKENQLKIIEEEIKELNEEIEKLSQKKENLESDYSQLRLPVMESKNNYHILNRIFRNSYKKALKEHYHDLEEYEKEKIDLEEELISLQNEIGQVAKKKDEHNKSLEAINAELEQLTEQLEKFNNKSNVIKYILENKPALCQNKKIMSEAIEENVLFIAYDKSDDINLYIKLFQLILEKFEMSDYAKKSINSIIAELVNPSPSIEGMYNIPLKYLFEGIRNNIIGAKYFYVDPDINSIINSIIFASDGALKFIELNNHLPIKYGEELQKLWDDDSIRIGVHAFASFL